MFYRPEDGHGLAHSPINAIVAPRPIGWISTRGRLGCNLAPYSFFNLTAYVPPQVMFASVTAKPDRHGTKDSIAQIAESRVFCVNIAGAAMKDAMNASSAALPAGTDEFEVAGLKAIPCETIDCPRVEGAAASLECRATKVLRLAGKANFMALGVITGIHLRDDLVQSGVFDLRPEGWLARMGHKDYAIVTDLFEMERP